MMCTFGELYDHVLRLQAKNLCDWDRVAKSRIEELNRHWPGITRLAEAAEVVFRAPLTRETILRIRDRLTLTRGGHVIDARPLEEIASFLAGGGENGTIYTHTINGHSVHIARDYSSLQIVGGHRYEFGRRNQQTVIYLLVDAAINERPGMSEDGILRELSAKRRPGGPSRLRDVFYSAGKYHPAWRTLIVRAKTGAKLFSLQIPPVGFAPS